MILDQRIFSEADSILKSVYGVNAQFREGQYEAIEATMIHKHTLVVQKTGWGKSLVYFICTKIFRSRNRGMTMVISPLLVLMENQMEMAKRLGIHCAALNSTVSREERHQTLDEMANQSLDLVFITPETLFKDEVQMYIPRMRLGLFVIDEAHCISDWGHDFRLDYGKIGRIIQGMPSHVAVLATTATANDRVVNDLKKQLGDQVFISRGPLARDSLHIQVLRLERKVDRYAWLLENLPKLPGTGIIYCLDRRDCDYLAGFLMQNSVPAMAYYSRDNEEDEKANNAAIDAFQNNRIKAIVATVKLGMGYDKGDISFVIHFQTPGSIVAWYQQIGRAGRNLQDAYVFLMSGYEDDDINDYFIENAFPTRKESEAVFSCISNADGIAKNEIIAQVNARSTRIEKALYFLENEGFIRKEYLKKKWHYYPTPKRFVYNESHYRDIKVIRRKEREQIRELINTQMCLSRFAVNCLDDNSTTNCEKCSNCTGKDVFPGLTISDRSRKVAFDFINSRQIIIQPRKQWPDRKRISSPLQEGICLSKYGDCGWGELVARGKYPQDGSVPKFDDRLVEKAASTLAPLIREKRIEHLTFVPSLRNSLVKDFAKRLAEYAQLQYIELLDKRNAPQQKSMENGWYQCKNALESFEAKNVAMPERVILVDDVIDSGWTLTVCGCKIIEKGCKEVYPFALASSRHEESS